MAQRRSAEHRQRWDARTHTKNIHTENRTARKRIVEKSDWAKGGGEKVTPSSRKNAQMNGKSLGMARRICNKFGIGLVPRREMSLGMRERERKWELETCDYNPRMRFETMRWGGFVDNEQMEGDEHLGFRRAHGKHEKGEIEQMSVRGEDGREKMMESTTYGIGTRVQQ